MGSRELTHGRTIVARLPYGADLLEAVLDVATRHGVEAGALSAVGALQRARLSFYVQSPAAEGGRGYRPLVIERPTEIAALSGTISHREGRHMVHAHACLSDETGQTIGGHLDAGCIVFACEVVLTELMGATLDRAYDDQTGLYLWKELEEEDGVGRGT